MTTKTLLILFTLLSLVAARALGSGTPDLVTEVRLRSTVRLQSTQSGLTLGEVAEVNGLQSENLQALAISTPADIEPGKWTVLTFQSLREQLKTAPGVNFGAIVMHGGDIQITRMLQSSPVPKNLQSFVEHADTNDSHRLRELIEQWVYKRLKTTPKGTRITFNERDRAILETPTAGRIVEIRELGRSDQMVLNIVIYEHDRIVLERAIRFEALVERPVLVSTASIKRDTPISIESTRVETRWLAPTEPIADPVGSIGQVAVSTIDPGRVLNASMIESPILVQRGQIVSARSLAGSVSVTLMVRAKQSGRLGEIIELESRDRKQKFNARIAGAGRVVIMPDAPQNRPNASTSLYGSP